METEKITVSVPTSLVECLSTPAGVAEQFSILSNVFLTYNSHSSSFKRSGQFSDLNEANWICKILSDMLSKIVIADKQTSEVSIDVTCESDFLFPDSSLDLMPQIVGLNDVFNVYCRFTIEECHGEFEEDIAKALQLKSWLLHLVCATFVGDYLATRTPIKKETTKKKSSKQKS